MMITKYKLYEIIVKNLFFNLLLEIYIPKDNHIAYYINFYGDNNV